MKKIKNLFLSSGIWVFQDMFLIQKLKNASDPSGCHHARRNYTSPSQVHHIPNLILPVSGMNPEFISFGIHNLCKHIDKAGIIKYIAIR